MHVSMVKILFAVIFIKTTVLANGDIQNNTRRPTALSASRLMLHLLRNYDKSEPPEGTPIVKLGIYINDFYAVSDLTMEYSLTMYLRQKWVDKRLQYEPFNNKKEQQIKLEDHMWDKIWTPDLFFRNEKRAAFHDITTPNRLIFLRSNGTVWYVSRITATLSCNMRLHKYPLDTQNCPMMFESFGYTMEHIVYRWLGDAVVFDLNIQLPQFTLVNWTLNDCSQNYTTGAYPCLEVNFILKRDIGFHMIQMYIPSVFIVILSWISFWISIDAIPARITIGLLTVWTMTMQSTGSRSQLPRVSYITAIDVWMFVCLIFVYTSLLEFAVVNVFARKEEIALEEINTVTQDDCDSRSRLRFFQRDPQRARYIDKLSRKLFPLAFISFNIIYWLAYILG